MHRRVRSVMASCGVAVICGATAACGGDGGGSAPVSYAPATTARCQVHLHGKTEDGAATDVVGDVSLLRPAGNDEVGGGRQWLYFPEERYTEAAAIVTTATDGCEQVILSGFSNGAAFAAKLFCRGETFAGRLVGVVVDDPVVDRAVEGCAPAPGVDVTLYWTGELEERAQPGWSCDEGGWTCEGGETIGIDAYAAALGTDAEPSVHRTHVRYDDAPALSAWR